MADIDQLYAEWQASPTGATSLALCNALRGSSRHDLVEIVGAYTARHHKQSIPALIAVGRMYMECGRYDDAQAALLGAGKVAPRDPGVYRWLGEVLLHKGDADRAEKVLERAIGFGGNDDETVALAERARYLKGIERAAGQSAAAHEFRKWLGSRGVPAPRRPEPSVSDLDTQIRKDDEVRGALQAALGLSQVAAAEPSLENLARAATGDPSFRPVTGANPGAPGASRAAPQSGGTAPAFFPPSSERVPAAPPPSVKPASRPPPPVARPLAAPPPPPPMAPNPFTGPPNIVVPEPAKLPDPRDVLDALALAGVYEPDQSYIPAATWDRPGGAPSRKGSTALLVLMLVVFIGGSAGAYFFVKDRRAKEHAQAEALLTRADLAIKAGDHRALPEAEKSIGRAFDLESRSEHAAMSWLRERAVVGLTKGGADVALEDATARAKEVDKRESDVAFAYVASFLFQGDTAGAISVMPKWDGPAAQDAWYQLLAGATLERAGDARAIERYAAATRSDPDLVVAEIGFVRTMAMYGDPKKAMELAKNFRARVPDRPEGVALVALAWARDPNRGDAPPEVEEATRLGDLPISLRVVPHALLAIRAAEKKDPAQAKTQIEKGLAVADSPASATWLGLVAVDLGDEALARRAALTALAYSAIFPPARVLAARVALLAGRLDEAVKATEELDAALPDVAVVRAAASYERLDADGLARALDTAAKDTRKLKVFSGANAMPDVLFGRPLPADRAVALAAEDSPWADVVAMDSALDAGDLDLAEKLAVDVRSRAATPARKLRLARLARYQGKADVADKLSDESLRASPTARAVLERAMSLVAANRAGDVALLLKSYPQALGPLTKWVAAYGLAKSGKVDEARGRTASEDPPVAAAPLPARLVALSAMGAMKAPKLLDPIKALVGAGIMNPDVLAAAEAAGLKLRRKP